MDGGWLAVDVAGWRWMGAGGQWMRLVGGERGMVCKGWGWLALAVAYGRWMGAGWNWIGLVSTGLTLFGGEFGWLAVDGAGWW